VGRAQGCRYSDLITQFGYVFAGAKPQQGACDSNDLGAQKLLYVRNAMRPGLSI